jgi:biopolymer transport protein ExbD
MRRNSLTPPTGQAVPQPMMEMNMTPLIDVMLVLIIMLIITIPRQQHALDLQLGGKASEGAPPLVVTVDVDFDGAVLWDGQPVAGEADLARKFALAASSATPPDVHVRANRLVAYKSVASVMAIARRAGIQGIGLIGNEQYL